jgi:putative transposase
LGTNVQSRTSHCITPDDVSLADVIRDFKKYTATALVESIKSNSGESRKRWLLDLFAFAGARNVSNKTYQVWQHGNHAEALFSEKLFAQKLDYVHNNPVRNGLVERPEDYRYSSARDYVGQKGLIEIEPIVLKVFVR